MATDHWSIELPVDVNLEERRLKITMHDDTGRGYES